MSSGAAILFVEDEAPFRRFAGSFLEESGLRVVYAADGSQSLTAFEAVRPDLVLLDLDLPDLHGLEVLRRLRTRVENQRVIVLTAYGDAATAVRALKAGATDYLTKPVELSRLLDAVRDALSAPQAEVVVPAAELARGRPSRHGALLGEHPDWLSLLDRLERVAASGLQNVLLLGESGTGKTSLARRFHRLGPQAAGPFVEVNVPSLPAELLEAELFGVERAGAATRRGKIELAHTGTLLLDEMGALPPRVQAKLLSFLEERSFRRVGGHDERRADVRLVCTTHCDLRRAVERGDLRRDLYYRLEVVSLRVPPLRERGDDVGLLAEHFLAEARQRRGSGPRALGSDARRALREQPFPGNVRELAHLIERSAALHPERQELTAADLDLPRADSSEAVPPGESSGMLLPVDLEAVLDALEGHYVLQALSRGSSQREAGALLGLDRFALARRRSRLRHRGGRKAVARILAEAPQWLRDIMLPHPGDLPGEGLALLEVRSQLESRAIAVALRANGGNRARAATVLGMSRTSLNRRLA